MDLMLDQSGTDRQNYRYTGTIQPSPGELDHNGRPRYPYLSDDALIEAVNLAIVLRRPLLVKGEPGSGKTRLAQAVAYELGLPYRAIHVKSISKARDILYTYDSIGRLRDAQLAASGRMSPEEISRTSDPGLYVRYGPMGEAYLQDKRTVVLVDEIDKADIDFPNDLLLELDERRFVIDETGQAIVARNDPIVFITSNDEKDLPDAFLRRCLFHYIGFPSRDTLVKIVLAHFPSAPAEDVGIVVNRFVDLREQMRRDKGEAGRKTTTSELIDWFMVLSSFSDDDVIAQLGGELRYPSVLLKSWQDHRKYLGI
jgi:MoxR-like ATPase